MTDWWRAAEPWARGVLAALLAIMFLILCAIAGRFVRGDF